ncbi:hypothetical protein ON010_g1963 [Phytophthora cinnamomi]|nr:hypothetical protein ON010_g1963 [Phytophthora cinnamomi]
MRLHVYAALVLVTTLLISSANATMINTDPRHVQSLRDNSSNDNIAKPSQRTKSVSGARLNKMLARVQVPPITMENEMWNRILTHTFKQLYAKDIHPSRVSKFLSAIASPEVKHDIAQQYKTCVFFLNKQHEKLHLLRMPNAPPAPAFAVPLSTFLLDGVDLKSNLLLSFCENEAARRYSTLDPICVETLVSGMTSLTKAVERSIALEIPDRFGLIFDEWMHSSEHYIAVYACYEVEGEVTIPLLCMAPLLEEKEDLSPRGHMEFLITMLPRDFGKQLDQCCFLVDDNCSVKKRLATLVDVPLVGCASHRLNRAVQADMQDYEEELDTVQKLMIRLRTLTQSARLRAKTQLRPVIRQDTRWSSTFAILNRYFKSLEFINSRDDDIADLMPSPAPDFEAGCVKVLGGNTSRLTRAEKSILTPFAVSNQPAETNDDEEEDSFVEQLQKRRRLAAKETKYKLLHIIPATSSKVELVFSVARITFGHERHGLMPITLEMIIFLRENAAYWDAKTVDEAMH